MLPIKQNPLPPPTPNFHHMPLTKTPSVCGGVRKRKRDEKAIPESGRSGSGSISGSRFGSAHVS